MIPRINRVICAVILATSVLASSQMRAEESAARSSGKVVSFAEANHVNELYVAIMGEVDTPGTYRLDSTSLKLHHLLRCARGFTSDASRTVRIIRSGKVRQKEIFSEHSDSPLVPGDLLIVESRRLSFRSGKIASTENDDDQTIRAGYEEGTIRAGIQIALVNVLEYPVVLRLRADQANASYLIQALGQPMSLLAGTRIITPDIPGRLTSDAAKRAPRLEDGSVLVFEPGKVNRNRLPVTLPAPYDDWTSHSSEGAVAALHRRSSRDLRNLGQHPFWSNADPFDTTQNHSHPTQPTASSPVEQAPNVLEIEQFTNVSADMQDDTDQDQSGSLSVVPVASHETDSSRDESLSTPLSITVSPGIDQPIDVEPAQFSIFPLLILFLVVGALTGLVVRINRSLLSAMMKSKAGRDASAAQSQTAEPAEVASEQHPAVAAPATAPSALQTHDPYSTERMTIPIREIVEPSTKRQTLPPSAGTQPAASTTTEADTTPLAKALLQLEQRRRA